MSASGGLNYRCRSGPTFGEAEKQVLEDALHGGSTAGGIRATIRAWKGSTADISCPGEQRTGIEQKRVHTIDNDTVEPREAILADGNRVRTRPIEPGDTERERRFFLSLSESSRHERFLAGIAHLTDAQLKQLCNVDYHHDMAFVAVSESDGSEDIIGVARYVADGGGEDAEIAVTVQDKWQNKGLGTALMMRLIQHATKVGIRKLYSINHTENQRIMALLKGLGFRRHLDPDDAATTISSLELSSNVQA